MKVAVFGANGYIGVRLIPKLVEAGHQVVCFVRNPQRLTLPPSLKKQVDVAVFDLLEQPDKQTLPADIDAAYYLVHSMSTNEADFEELEFKASVNFVDYINSTSCTQIIFLSGLMNDKVLSPHLRSRKRVEENLKLANAATTILRAGIIVGSGSASFEIIRDIVEKLPVMVTPKWVDTKCQPIAIRDVLQYLTGVLALKSAYNDTFDIGGPDVLTYKQMLLQFAEVRGLKRHIHVVPVLTPRLSSYWLYFITSTSYPLAKNLVDSMKTEVIVKDDRIKSLVPGECLSYKDAVSMAFDKIKQNDVVSSWKDAFSASQAPFEVDDFVEVPDHGCFKDYRKKDILIDHEAVIENIWRIGGENGWYIADTLWELRGLLDKMVGGVGLRRGRRSPTDLTPGDALDFWRVLVADKGKGRLLLYAEMKLPGEAWLEFRLNGQNTDQPYLEQIATFRPDGLGGRAYWYSILPFHDMIFEGMAKALVSTAQTKVQTTT